MDAGRLLLIVLVMAITASACLAEPAQDPYKAPALETGPPWMAILLALVFLVGVLAVGFKNSKRTHLD